MISHTRLYPSKPNYKNQRIDTRPSTVSEVSSSMNLMDTLHHTSFSSWLRSESNSYVILRRHKPLLLSEYKENPNGLSLALQWMTELWTTLGTADFMTRLFDLDEDESWVESRDIVQWVLEFDKKSSCEWRHGMLYVQLYRRKSQN